MPVFGSNLSAQSHATGGAEAASTAVGAFGESRVWREIGVEECLAHGLLWLGRDFVPFVAVDDDDGHGVVLVSVPGCHACMLGAEGFRGAANWLRHSSLHVIV